MKVALVGIGYWGSKILRNLVSLVGLSRVVAVEPDPERLAAVVRQYPSISLEPGLVEVLDDPGVGAVIVATPVRDHVWQTRAALRAGRHVLVEKPLATSVQDATELAQLAADHGRVLMVGHTFLFSPKVSWVAERIHSHGIGRLHYLTSARLNLGLHRNDASVIWDLGPHDVAILLHLLGECPVTVQTGARGVVRDVPDVAFMNLRFGSGVICSVAVSWLAPRKVRSLVVVGENGMIVYDDMQPEEPVKVYDKGVEGVSSDDFGIHQLTYKHGDTVAPHIPLHEPLSNQVAHFLGCVEGGRPPLSDGRFGAQVVAVLEAADRSWQQGGVPVDVEQLGSPPPAVQPRTLHV